MENLQDRGTNLIRTEFSVISYQDPETAKEQILSVSCTSRHRLSRDHYPFAEVESMLIEGKYSVTEMASLCHMCETSFKKKFTAYYHESPHRWFIRQRLTFAAEALLTEDLSVKEIGHKYHFDNTSHFIRCFRLKYGLTPKQYREKYLEY